MIWFFFFAAAVQTSPQQIPSNGDDVFQQMMDEAAKPLPPPPSKKQVDGYVQSLADAPDAVALSLDKDGELRKIYAAYYQCYRDSLDRDPRSDLRDLSDGKLAFKSAYNACSAVRTEADTAAITYAKRDSDLKTEDQRRQAIEYYRGWRGQIMLRDYYQQRGKSAQFRSYVDEMTRTPERGQ